jgi:glycosyltransferase involved in cell wall biosynthesis
MIDTLAIVSPVVHCQHDGRIFAYGPYAREIEVWADLFPRVVIAAPSRTTPPRGDDLPLTRPNVTLEPQLPTGGDSTLAKARQLVALPRLVRGLSRAMSRADAIHVRCPGNLGLLGVLLAPLFSRYIVAKYAGQWNGYPGEPRTTKLQRSLLKSRWWRGPVTVYGAWPDQPPHVMPFFASILTAQEMRRAREAAASRGARTPPRVLYAGRLARTKGVDVLLVALAQLRSEGLELPCRVVGDGPERVSLGKLARDLGLHGQVIFEGAMSIERVLAFYEDSDVLVLVSKAEGWPKAIAEAMAFGLICVGSDRGLLPGMLAGGRGVVVAPRDVHGLASILRQIAAAPDDYREMRARAAAWGQQRSLEDVRDGLSKLLTSSWGACLDPRPSRPI